MINAAERFEEVKASFIRSREKFAGALGEIGPHPIPKHRQVANEYHLINCIKAEVAELPEFERFTYDFVVPMI